MDFDLNETIAQMAGAIKGEVKESWGVVHDIADAFLAGRKQRLDLLVDMRLKDEIDDEFLKNRLDDEKTILESELYAVTVISKAIAQRAANAAFKVLEDVVGTVLKAL